MNEKKKTKKLNDLFISEKEHLENIKRKRPNLFKLLNKKKTKKLNAFKSNLHKGIKHARGKKAKAKREDAVDYETFEKSAKEPARSLKAVLLSEKKARRSKKQKPRLVRFFEDSPFHGIDLKLQRDKSPTRR